MDIDTTQVGKALAAVIKELPRATKYPAAQFRVIGLKALELSQQMLWDVKEFLANPSNAFVQDAIWAFTQGLQRKQSTYVAAYGKLFRQASGEVTAPQFKDDLIALLVEVKATAATLGDLDAMKPWFLKIAGAGWMLNMLADMRANIKSLNDALAAVGHAAATFPQKLATLTQVAIYGGLAATAWWLLNQSKGGRRGRR